MNDFINFETGIDENVGKDEDDEVSEISEIESDFIDDQEVNTDINLYRQFDNVENDIEQVLRETYNETIEDIENFDEISNLCDGSEDEIEIDDFKNFELEIKKFNESLFPRVDNENEKVENQFCKVVLYALRFDKTELKDTCNNEEFEKIIDKDLFEKLSKPEKLKFIIDLQKFHNLCYEINSILSKHNYFLRVFELQNKFR